jgi:hypothetical protein
VHVYEATAWVLFLILRDPALSQHSGCYNPNTPRLSTEGVPLDTRPPSTIAGRRRRKDRSRIAKNARASPRIHPWRLIIFDLFAGLLAVDSPERPGNQEVVHRLVTCKLLLLPRRVLECVLCQSADACIAVSIAQRSSAQGTCVWNQQYTSSRPRRVRLRNVSGRRLCPTQNAQT